MIPIYWTIYLATVTGKLAIPEGYAQRRYSHEQCLIELKDALDQGRLIKTPYIEFFCWPVPLQPS